MTNVQQALAAASAAIGAVGKNQRMEAGPARYNYRGLDDLMDAAHGPLADNGITFAPHKIKIIDKMERTTRSGSIQYHLRALITYRIYGPEADWIETTVLAEGTDTGDKAGNKLMSGALKYALGQVLAIPYTMDDQDQTLSEHVPARTPPADWDQFMLRLVAVSGKLGISIEQATQKYRDARGGVTIDEIDKTPLTDAADFLGKLEQYAETKNSNK